jgi:transcription-repair coupling factor (superfamily II helicase)
VENIDAMGSYLKKLVPEAKIGIGHGQMEEETLEETMIKFIKKEINLLLCTTIIESGLDIPSANTLIVNRADQFGLAQLYQLRGRVGRSEKEAFAYLLIPGEELITQDALKRLKVLKRFTELGSGLKIALHDLEIRGAGNLLGASQSGHIAAVGLELYTQLLDQEVKRLKGEPVEVETEPEILCPFPAFLPEEYVASTGERLLLYKRLSSSKSETELNKIKEEIRDRFGPYPPTVNNLFEVIEMKILARKLGISKLKLSYDSPSVEFSKQVKINVDRLLTMVKKDRNLKLKPGENISLELTSSRDGLKEIREVLYQLI